VKLHGLDGPNGEFLGMLEDDGVFGAGPNGRVKGEAALVGREVQRDLALL
jgi:hypothetical protein